MDISKLNNVFVARQPIFDIKNQVSAYELLFRSGLKEPKAVFDDPDQASLSVIADGFHIASSSSSLKKPFFVNFPKNLLLNESVLALPPEHCVVEILETISVDKAVINACLDLKSMGYKLALDDYTGSAEFDPLLRMVDYIKVDVMSMTPQQVQQVSKFLKQYDAKILAEKVEDIRIMQYCLKLGFELFQGFFFRRPVIISGKKLSSNEVSRFRIFKKLSNPDLDIKDLSDIIEKEATLSYRLLRYINSAYFDFSAKIVSIKQAVSMLGVKNTKIWLRVNLLSDMNQTPIASEVCTLAVQRAQFLKIASAKSQSASLDPDSLFIVGLFSLLDTLLGIPMQEILINIPLDDAIKEALCGNDTGTAAWLQLCRLIEEGNWNSLDHLILQVGSDPETLSSAYSQAQEWTGKLFINDS